MRRWEKKMKPLHCKTVLEAYCDRDSLIAMKMESSFATLIGSHGWHVYQKSTWKNPKKDEALSFKNKADLVALRFDPFSLVFTKKSFEYFAPLRVGHIPLEIARFNYFLFGVRWKHGGKGISNKVWGISNSKGQLRDLGRLQNWRRKKALSLEIGRFD